MTQPCVTIWLDDNLRSYSPGDVLKGQFQVDGIASDDLRAVELSVLWHTDGKGDEDMSVHFFDRTDLQHGEPVDVRRPRPFSTILPNSPLTYRGFIVKICWCVRVRVFLVRGKELSEEVEFQLGAVPHPHEVAT